MKVTYKTINIYLQRHKSSNTCGHESHNIKKDDFDIIGDLYDDSFGFLTYLSFKTKNEKEIFTGSYPLYDCAIWKCKTCNQIVFAHLDSGGVFPRPEYFLADYNKEYLIEPAAKSVSFSKDRLDDFLKHFDFKELLNADNIHKINSEVVIDKSLNHILNYSESGSKETGITLDFKVIGKRKLLKEIHEWVIGDVKDNKMPSSDSAD